MSEEIRNASVVVPRSIMLSLIINGILGFGMLIAEFLSIGDIDAVINTQFQYPFIEIFFQATNNIAGTAVMVAVVLIIAICTSVGVLASASRMLWSFARDRGVPGWQYIRVVSTLLRSRKAIWQSGSNGSYRLIKRPQYPSLLSLSQQDLAACLA